MAKKEQRKSLTSNLFDSDDTLVITDPLKTNDFASEKSLLAYVKANINDLIMTVYGKKVSSIEPEKQVQNRLRLSPRPPSVDLFVVCDDNTEIIIELKNPKTVSENDRVIGQILKYSLYYPNAKLLAITTLLSQDIGRAIYNYDLPIDYCYLDKTKILKYMEPNGK